MVPGRLTEPPFVFPFQFHFTVRTYCYQDLLREMKRANNTGCPQDMASYGAHDLTEFKTLSADMGEIGGIE